MRPRLAALSLCVLLAACASAPERRALAEEYYNLGNAYLAAGRVERALEFFERALELEPRLLQAHYNMSLALVRSGQGERAVAMLRDLLRRDPDNVRVASLLGYVYYRLGRFEESLAVYEAALARAPGDRQMLYNEAMVLWKLDRRSQAVEALEDVARTDEPDELALAALRRLAELHAEGSSWAAAAASLERYLERRPDDAPALLEAARAYREGGRYLDALRCYRRAAGLAPSAGEAWMGQAELLLTVMDDPESGIIALERALELGTVDPERLKALLESPSLAERERVRALVTAKTAAGSGAGTGTR